jgi:glycerophosphoryl diester phosphodiesterase
MNTQLTFNRRKNILLPVHVSLAVYFVFFVIACTSVTNSRERQFDLLAHRGLYQTFSPIGVTNDTCTASRIDPPSHDYIENTLPAIKAAIDLGADIIEFDVHPTIDNEFVVFHDWTLECRTDGKGIVRKQSLAYLKSLDIGYGYTADHGKSYPFRGKFIGAMPTLNEVLTAFPDTQFIINIKSRSKQEAELLTRYLRNSEKAKRKRLYIYGNGEGIKHFAERNKDLMTFSKQKAKSCIKSYLLFGWSGYIPEVCHKSLVPVPENYQWLIWGWPNRFEDQMRSVGSRSVLVGAHKDGKANSGIDSIDSFKRIPEGYQGIVLTNRIDLIGKEFN